MLLVPRVKHLFRSVIRARGDAYVRGRHVSRVETTTERAIARVRGSEGARYEVEFRVIDEGRVPSLGVRCTCPHAERGERCKHSWATLRVLDLEGWSPPALQRIKSPVLTLVDLLEGDEEEDDDTLPGLPPDLDDDDDDDDDGDDDRDLDPRTIAAIARPIPGAPASPVARGGAGWVPGWRARIEGLSSPFTRAHAASLGATPGSALASDYAPLLFLLDIDEIRSTQQVRVHFARRSVRRDGGLAPVASARLESEDIRRASSVDEARTLSQILDLVRGEASIGYGGFGSYASLSSGISPYSVVLRSALLDPVLPRLAETGRLALAPVPARQRSRGDTATEEPRPLVFDDGPPWQLRLRLGAHPAGGWELSGHFARDGASLALESATLVLAAGFLIEGQTLARADVGGSTRNVTELRRSALLIPARDLDAAIDALVTTPGMPPLDLGPGLPWIEQAASPSPRLRFDDIDATRPEIRARLDFGYGAAWVGAGAPIERVVDASRKTLFVRDGQAEADALQTLHGFGFLRAPRGAEDGATCVAIPRNAFEPAAHELLGKGWTLEVDGARVCQPGRSHASVSSGMDFFDLKGSIDFDGEPVSFPALLAAVKGGSRFVRLGDGRRGLLPRRWLERSAGLAGFAGIEGDALRFGRAQIGILDALLEAQDEARSDRRFQTLRRRLARFSGMKPADAPPGFRGALRGYQRDGLGWLAFLEEFGLGGCLADDMGLGKTVQVLALLAGRAKRRRRVGDAATTSLVVAPKSVVDGWARETSRFAPELRVLRYEGADRAALRHRFAGHDLVITTYGTMLRDVAELVEQRFDYVILDEAQAIKNDRSRTAQAARALRAEHRLALSGTPVENHLGELASLLEFLNPGLLGRARGFAALTGGRQDADTMAMLSRVLRPFLLRRTKAQVLSDLPPKTEQTLYCELEGRQRRDYDELLRHYRASLSQRIETAGLARSKIHVLEALLRLRQAACHPALIDDSRAHESSAKLDLLFERIEELIEEGHKVLVFSQFTRLLARVRERLEARQIVYAYLDGRTRNRAERVARFQDDADCPVFLISLKAGGTGLNLTAADYVFLLDPWWNPAVEAQAIDRTHRIGQSRPVFAYRIVARGTVEEKILALQEHKRALADGIFSSDESLVAGLDVETLRQILA